MINYGRHSIDDDDINAVIKALKGDWLTTGPLVGEFEAALETVVGAECVVVSSGTAALHCAYAAIGLGQGDEVITPPITFIATQATAALLGATVVFADVLPDTANIDPKAVADAITPRTKAIVAVDYAGHPADLDELRALADKYKIFLIEDASHSLGSKYKGRPIGSVADMTTFSFFPTKNITTAEGGAVASIHPELLLRARKFARQGLIRKSSEFQIKTEGLWHQEVQEFGLNYRLPDVLCALGINQLEKLEMFKSRKQEIFTRYTHSFAHLNGLNLPSERAYVDNNWHLFPIRVAPTHRLELYSKLREAQIVAQVNYLPIHLHPVFQAKGFKAGMFPVSESFYSQEISLPFFPDLTLQEQDLVIKTISDYCELHFS